MVVWRWAGMKGESLRREDYYVPTDDADEHGYTMHAGSESQAV